MCEMLALTAYSELPGDADCETFNVFFLLLFVCVRSEAQADCADAVDSCGATNNSCCSVELQPVACMEHVTGDVDYVSRALEVRHGVQPLTMFFFLP